MHTHSLTWSVGWRCDADRPFDFVTCFGAPVAVACGMCRVHDQTMTATVGHQALDQAA